MTRIYIKCWKCGNKFESKPDIVDIFKGVADESEDKAEETKEIIVEECPICHNMNRIEIDLPSSGAGQIEVLGSNPSASDNAWIQAGKGYFTESPAALNTIAKDLVALNGALITAYIAALTFLKIPKTGILSPSQSLVWASLPILFWFLSTLFSAYASYTKEAINLESPSSIKKGLNNIISRKSDRITVGYVLLAAGLLTGAFFLVDANYSSTTLSDVQLVVGEDYISAFENMSMIEDNQTMITVPVTLIGESDTSYTVRKDNGEIIVFNKDQIVGIKYQS